MAKFQQSGLQKTLSRHSRSHHFPLTIDFLLSSSLQTYVTLKILKADVSKDSRELAILHHLSTSDPHRPGKDHVNGVHLCLVFPVMLSDGQVMTIRRQPRNAGYVREISKQILLGLDFLHETNLIHSGS